MAGEPTSDRREDLVALNMVDGIGPVHYGALVERLGSARAALAAPLAAIGQVRGIGPQTARRIAESRGDADGVRELALAAEHGITVLTLADEGYPARLREIHDPPPVLYVAGEIAEADRLAVALVGSRRATHYGRTQSRRLATGLAACGVCVVSGLARGIDTAAHRGALEGGGRTIAVLGNGLLRCYPRENRQLMEAVREQGAVVSEFPLERGPDATHFPRRNRVISGLSRAVVVVEAGLRSGALITATQALEQGREVLAVPGKVDSAVSRGVHRLLRDGAKLVEAVEDILEELGPDAPAPPAAGEADRPAAEPAGLGAAERKALGVLSSDPLAMDEIIRRSGLGAPEASSALTMLALKKLAVELPGKTFARR
jgi:DNA processing protein